MSISTKELSRSWNACLTMMAAVAFIVLPDMALAVVATNTPMGEVLCATTGWFTGNTGKGLATIAITVIGIGALLGKVSWGMAMIVGIGVAIIFGAAGIVNALSTTNVKTTAAGCNT